MGFPIGIVSLFSVVLVLLLWLRRSALNHHYNAPFWLWSPDSYKEAMYCESLSAVCGAVIVFHVLAWWLGIN